MTIPPAAHQLIALSLSVAGAAQDAPTIDGVGRAHATDTASRFACERLVGRIGYHQEFLDPDDVPRLDMALGVRLTELRVSGRTIRPAERAKAEALFATFAWIVSIDARCSGGRFEFTVTAMRKREWLDYVEERRPTRPQARGHPIVIAPDGTVNIGGRSL